MIAVEVAIVGAGLAGLTCARRLRDAGCECLVLEAADAVGGRVRTDLVDGFRLDRGFQVLLTAYPEARRWLDYQKLKLQRFDPGALVWRGGRFHCVSDPFRCPGRAWATFRAPVGTLADKARIARYRARSRQGSLESIFMEPETTALEALKAEGFSEAMIERFLRPWLGGIFLDRELETSSRMLRFVFRMFAEGDAAVPANGMQAIPEQLAAGLPQEALRLNAPVLKVAGGEVELASGERIRARQVVLATDGASAAALDLRLQAPRWRSVDTYYFAAPKLPSEERMIALDGEGFGPVNHLAVMNAVAPSYSRSGEGLIVASVVGKPELVGMEMEERIRIQMRRWWGEQVDGWRMLRRYELRQALPIRSPLTAGMPHPVAARLWRCGDWTATPSIQGAMESGRRVAEAILQLP
jgi:glycine/D-amino acid oxidase-like deaminating enzyme